MLALATGSLAVASVAFGFVEFGGFDPVVLAAALGAYALIAAIVLARIDVFHPHAGFGLANRITLARASLNCVLVGLLADPVTLRVVWSDGLGWAVAGTALVSLSLDGLDGRAARRAGLASRFGARFDIEVDAILLMTLATLAVVLGKAGPWVLLSGGLYYGFMAARRIWPWLAATLPAALWRKTVFVIQVTALLLVTLPVVVPPASGAIAATALAILASGFAVDLLWLARHARR